MESLPSEMIDFIQGYLGIIDKIKFKMVDTRICGIITIQTALKFYCKGLLCKEMLFLFNKVYNDDWDRTTSTEDKPGTIGTKYTFQRTPSHRYSMVRRNRMEIDKPTRQTVVHCHILHPPRWGKRGYALKFSIANTTVPSRWPDRKGIDKTRCVIYRNGDVNVIYTPLVDGTVSIDIHNQFGMYMSHTILDAKDVENVAEHYENYVRKNFPIPQK